MSWYMDQYFSTAGGTVSSKITVAMIVKNESRIIERCLDSILGKADQALIIDTGSTDSTVKTIMKWGNKHDFPVHVEDRPWVDFAHNRTELVARARSFCNSEGYFSCWTPTTFYTAIFPGSTGPTHTW